MLTFDQEEKRFTYRAVAVFISHDHVLLHQAPGDGFWALPGGRVEHGESAEYAVQREMVEELDVELIDLKPTWVVDNFFEFDGKQCHELGIYFLVTASPDSYIYQQSEFPGLELDKKLNFKWFPLKSHDDFPLYPSFLKTALSELPAPLQYIVHRDE